ncbi:Ppx/GppA phosphatase family protein [Reichenbachiella versicolor]|uniref:Ppx/GppA phosphatase family protein n=1 Tax=Reichenbachiella versicolor TaxID=1821036 RepID=UPI000D6E7B52|nr:exopolyphosphatase [Reichenbachiella versicolor]
MKVGVIDMGTNTFHLLITEKNDFNSVYHKEKVAVRIGKGGISDGIIADDAVARAINTLSDFKQTLQDLEVEEVYVTATSAVRSAKNQADFIKIVKEETGFEINVLSGEEEAFLIHQGVKQCIDFDHETGLIVDIGGGSIEFIIADELDVKWLKSYEIGGQRLIDEYHKSDPILPEEISNLQKYLHSVLQEVFEECKKHNAQYLIGSSGSFDTFWDIHNKGVSTAEDKPILTGDEFQSIYDLMITKDKTSRLEIPGMIRMRVDMIVGAAIVTKTILDECSFDLIKISSYALKEGVLAFGLPNRKQA